MLQAFESRHPDTYRKRSLLEKLYLNEIIAELRTQARTDQSPTDLHVRAADDRKIGQRGRKFGDIVQPAKKSDNVDGPSCPTCPGKKHVSKFCSKLHAEVVPAVLAMTRMGHMGKGKILKALKDQSIVVHQEQLDQFRCEAHQLSKSRTIVSREPRRILDTPGESTASLTFFTKIASFDGCRYIMTIIERNTGCVCVKVPRQTERCECRRTIHDGVRDPGRRQAPSLDLYTQTRDRNPPIPKPMNPYPSRVATSSQPATAVSRRYRKADRFNGILQQMAGTMLKDAGLPAKLWLWATTAAPEADNPSSSNAGTHADHVDEV